MTKYALIGFPLGHSLSAAMHKAAFTDLNLDNTYQLMPVAENILPAAIERLRQTEWGGFNITIPYKTAILPFLDEIDPQAKSIGAVNTVLNQHGHLLGFNTDATAFYQTLLQAGFNPQGKTVLLLGSGGAARAVAHALSEHVRQIHIISLLPHQGNALADAVRSHCEQAPVVHAWCDASFSALAQHGQLIVNCTPLGMAPDTANTPWPEQINMHPDSFVFDLVYNPQKTRLLKFAQQSGLQGCSGLDMLVEQGALAFEIWTGRTPDRALMQQVASKILEEDYAQTTNRR